MDNLNRELGKKTGKAIGNALYGEHADDARISKRISLNKGNGSNLPNVADVDYEAIEKAKRQSLEHEQELNLLNAIISIEFNANDKNSIVKELVFLSSSMDLWLKQSNKNLRVAKSQFETGLAMLNIVDAENPMITHFENKKSEWQEFTRKQRIKNIIIGAVIAAFFITIIIVGLVN